MLNLIVMFKFSLLGWKYPFRANLIQKGNIIWLRWNLVPRLVQICWIRWQCPFDVLWTENTLLEKIWSKKIKLSIFYHCLSCSQNETFKKCQIFLFYIKNYKRKLKKLIRLIAKIYLYNTKLIMWFYLVVLYVCPYMPLWITCSSSIFPA